MEPKQRLVIQGIPIRITAKQDTLTDFLTSYLVLRSTHSREHDRKNDDGTASGR